MIIQSSNIGMNSMRNYSRQTTTIGKVVSSTATIKAKIEGNSIINPLTGEKLFEGASKAIGMRPAEQSETEKDKGKEKDGSGLTFSDRLEDSATEQMTKSLLGLRTGTNNTIADQNFRKAMEDIRRKCIEFLMRIFYRNDKERYLGRADSVKAGDVQPENPYQQEFGALSGTENDDAFLGAHFQLMQPHEVQIQTFTVSQSIEMTYEETEQTGFSAMGKVINKNGQEFDINVELTMSRSFMEHTTRTSELSSMSMVDPLVINLDTNIAGLSDQKFLFDIDTDGILDTISQLNAGSGYLALDHNGDGVINDGSELFGTASGDGFADLAKYDSDGNGWIDEADEIWDKLLIWTKDENGADRLYHLTEKGVGAICLQNAATDFSLKSLKDNSTNGAIRSTGIFLYENGGVGTLQHLDVAN